MSESSSQERQLELTGPGRRLMEARCALNLSREDVARQLRLKLELITAIEEDRVEELPAPIYVLGYLKNYAKLLKLPHEPVIDAYQQLRIEAPEIINEIVKPTGKRAGNRVVKWGSMIVGLVLLAGFIAWLQTQDFKLGKTEQVEPQGAVEPETAEIAAEEAAPEGNIAPLPAEESIPAAVETPSVAPAPAETPPTAVIPPENPPANAAAEGDKIVISLRDDCWVEIKDTNGSQLIYDLLRKGRSYEFYGKAPFTVFFGNARAVDLSVNDKVYDVTPHMRGKLARFKLNVTDAPE